MQNFFIVLHLFEDLLLFLKGVNISQIFFLEFSENLVESLRVVKWKFVLVVIIRHNDQVLGHQLRKPRFPQRFCHSVPHPVVLIISLIICCGPTTRLSAPVAMVLLGPLVNKLELMLAVYLLLMLEYNVFVVFVGFQMTAVA